MKILCKYDELLPLHKIIPNPKNPNEHSTDSTDFLAKNIDYQGIRWPIIISNRSGFIAAGHGRLYAAQQLKYASFPVVYQDFETEAQEYEFLVADNKLAEFSSTNEDLVLKALKDLPEIKIDMLAMPGLEDSIEDDQVKEGQTEDDAVPEVEDNPYGVKRGDIWELGEHRVMCGDSTSKEDVDRLMGGERVDMVVTDPPYNVALGMDETEESAKARNRRTDGLTIKNDKMSDSDFRSFLLQVFNNYSASLVEGGSIYVFHADSEGYNFRGAFIDAGLLLKQCLIWNKSTLVMGRQDYQWKHEPILYGWKPGKAHKWNSDRKQTTVLDYDKPSSSKLHPTMKPVEMVLYFITNSSDKNSSILDLFLGSGSTLIACEKTNRKCYGMEIDEHYVSVIIKRWEDFTGLKARRITTAN